ncbi:MAG TPA: sterol desaturase family protein [Burkholderiales bacterium]|nr:sterol desaturase family protein [Burkholderiales bacterium]
MDAALTVTVLGAGYASLFVLERVLPLRRAKAHLLRRIPINVAISAAAFAAAAILVQPAAAATLRFTESASFGLIRLAGLSGPWEIIAAFLMLDLTFYYWHVANHRIDFLWRFHNVHHIDPDLDVSTSFRLHFVEVALSAGFRAVQVVVIGPSVLAYVVYGIAFELGTLFHHSNVRLPSSSERALNKALVTPRMHGIHHSDIREENLANFGVVFPWWDKLHGTLRLNVPQRAVTIGIPGYARPTDNRILDCFAMPFRPQRQYWRGSHGMQVRREPATPAAGRNRLAA